MDFYETLKLLSAQTAPTGFEAAAVRTAKALLEPLVDEAVIDRLGSVIGIKYCGKTNAKRLLLDAHLDEVGLIVTGIDDGFLRFAPLGMIDPRILPGREVTVLAKEGPLFGVVTCLAPHVQTSEEREKTMSLDDLRIDIGLTRKEAEALVPTGTPVSYREACVKLQNGQICGKSLDNRACFTVLLRTAELLREKSLNIDLYFMGSVREETGGAGAIVGANAINPDWCVVTDVTFARTPGTSEDHAPCNLFQGPAIGVGPNMTRALTERMILEAKALDIPYQYEVMERESGTNAWGIQICLEGIPTSVVSLPLKYMHTPTETVAEEDMENMAKLIAAFVENLGMEGD